VRGDAAGAAKSAQTAAKAAGESAVCPAAEKAGMSLAGQRHDGGRSQSRNHLFGLHRRAPVEPRTFRVLSLGIRRSG
jgi:hypothetical protein